MTLTTAATGFILFFIQVVQGQDGWGVTYTSTEVCALKGSTLELHCTYRHPSPRYGETYRVEKSFWFTKVENREPVDLTTDPEYTGRVTSTCHDKRCTLRITDVRESDSAEYKFRFITNQPDGRYAGAPGVTLTVRDPDLQATVSRSAGSNWTKLKCLSTCPLPPLSSYIWYKSGKRIQAETSSSYSGSTTYGDSFSCALKGFEDFPSPPVCVYDKWCNKVTYSNRRICAPKGSSVDVSCSYKSYREITSKSWFSPGLNGEWQSPSRVPGRVQVLDDMSGRSTLRISDLRESDSAEYRFRFTSIYFEWGNSLPGTTLTVTDLQVQVRRITAGESQTKAELRCHSSCSPAGRLSYVWFSNRQELTRERTSSYTGWVSVGEEISCALQGHERFPSPSVYAPKPPSVSVSPSAEIMEGSSVTLNCNSDAKPAANYTWFKRNKNLDFQPFSKEAQLVFSSIQSSDSGEYYCKAENELGKRTSEHLLIDVKYAPRLPSVSVSPSAKIVEGSQVTLTCESDANPAATYTWFKKIQGPPLGQQKLYHITSISPEQGGSYFCTSANRHGQINSSAVFIEVNYAPKLSSVSVTGELLEGSSVTLTCKSDANPAATNTWYKEDHTPLQGWDGVHFFPSIRSKDSGLYYCKSNNSYGQKNSTSHRIDVQYPPRPPSVSVSRSDPMMEGSSVNLTCSSDANPAANYTWYKKNEPTFKGSGSVFTISDVKVKHSGDYYCEARNSRGYQNSTFLSVAVLRSMKAVAAGSISAILLVIFFLVTLFIWRKRSSKETSQPAGRPVNNRQTISPSHPTEKQEELSYASVRFSNHQDEAIYYNISIPPKGNRAKRQEEEDEDDVEYSVVNFESNRPSPQSNTQGNNDDSSAVYSAVMKTQRV